MHYVSRERVLSLTHRYNWPAIGVLFFLLCSRLLAMIFVPLNDPTEARYAEISRIMLETNNWITPMHHYGEPFWAKPPLSTWLSALSMKALGVTAFAARVPGLFLSIMILALVWSIAKKRSGKSVALNAVLILAGSFYFFLDAGTVMTDPALLFCTTLSLIAFAQVVILKQRAWRYVFFIGLGLGLLAKGPVALVLTGMPILAWVLWQKKIKTTLHELPWFVGGLLMLIIAVPWYVLAELHTPGFLNYFLIGEHLQRFLQPGWSGDKYGFAHIAPYGMIWLYAFLGMCPWSILAVGWVWGHGKKLRAIVPDTDGWLYYLLLCALLPLVFFTFARNIIYPYVFPSLPAFALLCAELIGRTQARSNVRSWILWAATLCGSIFLLATLIFVLKPELVAKSQQRVVTLLQQQPISKLSKFIYWTYKIDYSAQFYSAGRAVATLDEDRLRALISSNVNHYIIVDADQAVQLPADISADLHQVSQVNVLSKIFNVYRLAKNS